MIGIFDSGLGGLTAVKEMLTLSPSEELIYFGDMGRVPYGNRSSATITKYACQDAAFLMSKRADAIVVACGTVSYYVSDDPTMFVSNASLFLGGEINGTVEKININDY